VKHHRRTNTKVEQYKQRNRSQWSNSGKACVHESSGLPSITHNGWLHTELCN